MDPPQNGHGVPTLLLIEGDAPGRVSVRAVLEEAGAILEVDYSTSVADGLARLRAKPVSAVLLDLSLPDVRDLSAIAALRRAAPKVAIMILARATDQALARRAVDHGANDSVVTDQIDARNLVQLIAMMFERRASEAQKFVERERAEVTLNSIGDAVLTTDTAGHVTYLNAEAEALTGWTRAEAFARPLAEVFDVTDGMTGQHAVDPSRMAIEQRRKVRLKGSYVLVGRDGNETAIEHSAAPIQDRQGNIVGAVIVFRDVIVSRERRLQMLHLAEHDALTDLPNRLLLNDRLARSIALARRYGRRLAVLFLDCDRFKHINDTLGHAIGDQALRSVAKRLTACVRESDTVSRHGGDEFLILLSELDHPEDAEAIANKIVESMSEPHRVAGHDLQLTASVGIALYPEDGQDAQSLIMRADTAMYYAKNTGRNRVGFYRSDMEAPAIKRSSIESELQSALDRKEFALFYQPTIDLESGIITGAEALMRWRHPQRGLVSPASFIPLAEDTGLIVALGEWALNRACRDAVAWPAHLGIAVNLSPVQIRNGNLVEVVKRALSSSGLAASRLELEVTESVLLEHNAQNVKVLHELQELGVSIVLDDFGVGYSSMSYLLSFPFNKIKIDRKFVAELPRRRDCAAIVSAVSGLARSLNIATTAEGVETTEQATLLRAAGCTLGQGYLFGRPCPNSALDFTAATGIRRQSAAG